MPSTRTEILFFFLNKNSEISKWAEPPVYFSTLSSPLLFDVVTHLRPRQEFVICPPPADGAHQ